MQMHAEQPEFGEAAQQLARKGSSLEVITDDRQHSLTDERANRVAHQAFVVGEQLVDGEEIGGDQRASSGGALGDGHALSVPGVSGGDLCGGCIVRFEAGAGVPSAHSLRCDRHAGIDELAAQHFAVCEADVDVDHLTRRVQHDRGREGHDPVTTCGLGLDGDVDLPNGDARVDPGGESAQRRPLGGVAVVQELAGEVQDRGQLTKPAGGLDNTADKLALPALLDPEQQRHPADRGDGDQRCEQEDHRAGSRGAGANRPAPAGHT